MQDYSHKIVITKDGSSSIYIPELDEHYHSIHGAISESIHVFINAGFHSITKDEVSILEIGLGTGLNILLTLIDSARNNKTVKYTALEPYPINFNILPQLNFLELLRAPNFASDFEEIHRSKWNEYIEITPSFQLKKIKTKLLEYHSEMKFDVIYFDAFAPDVQPEMWTKEVFKKMHEYLKPEGRLVTYCAKGDVKRTLVGQGFIVESLPGPPGKREMVRAIRLPL